MERILTKMTTHAEAALAEAQRNCARTPGKGDDRSVASDTDAPTRLKPSARVDFSIVLSRPEIPHNTGAIGRLCVGLGVKLHLVRPLGFRLDDQSVARAGLDYWPYLDLEVHDTWEEYLAAARPRRMFFLSTHGEKSLYECRFEDGDALVFGNESSGLPKDFYARYRERLFRIPMPGEHARSINLANAVSIAAYECFRQLGNAAGKAVDVRGAQ